MIQGKIFKLLISSVFLITMLSFEVLNNFASFSDVEVVENSLLEDLTEKYDGEKQSESEPESKHIVELTLHDLRDLAFKRQTEKEIMIAAHDLNYQLLEQKVISPPPELRFS